MEIKIRAESYHFWGRAVKFHMRLGQIKLRHRTGQNILNESCYLVIRSRRMIHKHAWRHCTAMAILKLYAAKLLEEKVWGYHFGMCRPKESRMLRWLKNLAHSSALKNYRVMGKFPNVDHLFSIRAQGVQITNGKITWIIVTPVSSYRAFSDHTLEL